MTHARTREIVGLEPTQGRNTGPFLAFKRLFPRGAATGFSSDTPCPQHAFCHLVRPTVGNIPLEAIYSYEECQLFGRIIATRVHEKLPTFTSIDTMIFFQTPTDSWHKGIVQPLAHFTTYMDIAAGDPPFGILVCRVKRSTHGS